MHTSEVRFKEKTNGIVSMLEIASPERRSVLELVRGLLFELRVQIVQVESVVQNAGLLEKFDVVEFDGAPISKRRAALIRSAVKQALASKPIAAAS